ncbi:uncharacterized protein LOC115437936 [Sphaeramia orbicularis]|uniref:uncharacterized protein LOC115437936 n=1 Tax=Sphaeramia orbicularis TaxID=375764 RepID=UPI0011812EB6|nr:uncharacterized protein LOC115437936 [Sphaeramia orbicularis]
MGKVQHMEFLVLSLLISTQTAGGCTKTSVTLRQNNSCLLAGESFHLSCEFTCLGAQDFALLRRKKSLNEIGDVLVNMTSLQPNVTLGLHISSATKADTGYYSCRTDPAKTISRDVVIQITDNAATCKWVTPGTTRVYSALQQLSTAVITPELNVTAPNTARVDSNHHQPSTAGLQGQMWFWLLLGKASFLLLSLASQALKHMSR